MILQFGLQKICLASVIFDYNLWHVPSDCIIPFHTEVIYVMLQGNHKGVVYTPTAGVFC